MRKKMILMIILLISVLIGQDQYRSIQHAQDDWQDYTQFQKHELLSFCDFLITEGIYERALLSLFQYLYRYPGDSLETVIYYYIARSYEFSNNPELANMYYNRVQEISGSTDIVFRAAEFRKMYLLLGGGEYDQIFEKTELSENPYDLIFRGYAFFHKMRWIEARQAFLAAEEQFDHPYYSKRLTPMFKAIDASANVPLRNKWLSFTASFVPGGGYAYLDQWETAGGTIISFILISSILTSSALLQSGQLTFEETNQAVIPVSGGIKTINGSFTDQRGYSVPGKISLTTANVKMLIPPIVVGAGLYIGSIWKTWMDVDEANKVRVQRFVGKVTDKISIDRFMDFPEPELMVK
ncbi:MAG: hypothetical protein IIB95_03270 [Candidatus Marinimicrobia bacterium]|nr:hypothetical protein [Candidatus Neomarinimicrobiota bacterium]